MEKNLLHKNVGEDLTIAMMIKKVETYFGRGPTGQKPRISFFLRFKPLVRQPAPTNPTKLVEKMHCGFYHIPPNSKPKY